MVKLENVEKITWYVYRSHIRSLRAKRQMMRCDSIVRDDLQSTKRAKELEDTRSSMRGLSQ